MFTRSDVHPLGESTAGDIHIFQRSNTAQQRVLDDGVANSSVVALKIMRTISLALLTAGCALSFQATSGWIPDSRHPNVQYRFRCTREALSIDWRSSYLGAVSLRARVRGSSYDGEEQVVIPPSGTATS